MPSDPLTKAEARALVDMATRIGTPYTRARDAAAYAVLYRCGVRSEEAALLDLSDLREGRIAQDGEEVEVWSLRVRFPKGWRRRTRPAKPREMGVDPGTLAVLEAWLEVRGRAPGPLFQTTTGRRLDPSHWRRKIKRAASSARIEKRVHCHGLRHTYARMLHDEGVSIALIQQLLGHRDLSTTAIYLGSLGNPEAVAATARRDW